MQIKNQTKTENYSNKHLQKDIRLLSINGLSIQHNRYRFRKVKGYYKSRTKNTSLINPLAKYCVSNIDVSDNYKIFLLFNSLSINEKTIYDTVVKNMDGKAEIDINSYHNDYQLFKNLLTQKKKEYTHYIINPPIINNSKEFQVLIEQLPKEKLIIIGKKIEGISGNYGAVYENFGEDIFKALKSINQKLEKYKKLILIFSDHEQPLEIREGFVNFCINYQLKYDIISKVESHKIELGNAYIIPNDRDLIKIVKESKKQKLVIGKDFGIISYNEVPLKKIILNGLTTITSDFEQMGKTAAQLVLKSSKKHIDNPVKFIIRDSI